MGQGPARAVDACGDCKKGRREIPEKEEEDGEWLLGGINGDRRSKG